MNSDVQFKDTILIKQDRSKLENLVHKYPWCSVAQLSLLHLYKENNTAETKDQGAKTALFFKSQTWLQWQLNSLLKESVAHKNVITTDEPVHLTVADEIIHKTIPTENNVSSQPNVDEEIIAFEPLHTVDYFASQGIKITEEPLANDKLGSQMKSFTSWLKSMKKIHKENLPAVNEQTDKNIQQIAEHSNADAAIVTEAMADVLIKQNKREKAIEVYEKLSLLNPAKSAYFAGKIAGLKVS